MSEPVIVVFRRDFSRQDLFPLDHLITPVQGYTKYLPSVQWHNIAVALHNVYALFPYEVSDVEGRYCTCYASEGGHCGADYEGCIRNSLPVSPEEYASVRRDLEGYYGYNLVICERRDIDPKQAKIIRRKQLLVYLKDK